LRADAGEIDETLADWWQEFSMASDEVRQDMVDQVRAEQQQQRKQAPKGPRAAKPARDPRPIPTGSQSGDESSEPEFPESAADSTGDAPRKRRRRRRGGAARGAGEGGSAPSAE
jgi:poly(A) polymerase